MEIGSRVRLHGLARADLNGRDATVVVTANNDRIGVIVDGSIAPIAIKPVNLLATPGSNSSANNAAAHLDSSNSSANNTPDRISGDSSTNTVDLGSLPKDLIEHCLCLTASTHTLAQASLTSRLLQECASAAAIERGYSLGYDEFDVDNDRSGESKVTSRNAISELHRLHIDPITALLPPQIPIYDERKALQFLRDEFSHFEPRLCRTLHLPDVSAVPAQLRDMHGDTEYANLAALLRAAGSSLCSVPSIQHAIEGGWAEGFDHDGASHFHGHLGVDACIGASEVIVALWHLRFRASLVEIDSPRYAGGAIFQLVSALTSSSSSWQPSSSSPAQSAVAAASLSQRPYPNELPIFLQTAGESFLVVGVMRHIRKAVLLLQSPEQYEEPSIEVRSIQSLNGAPYQVVICHGRCGEMSTHEILKVNGQFRGMLPGHEEEASGEQISPAATFTARGWRHHPAHEWLRVAMAHDLPTSFV